MPAQGDDAAPGLVLGRHEVIARRNERATNLRERFHGWTLPVRSRLVHGYKSPGIRTEPLSGRQFFGDFYKHRRHSRSPRAETGGGSARMAANDHVAAAARPTSDSGGPTSARSRMNPDISGREGGVRATLGGGGDYGPSAFAREPSVPAELGLPAPHRGRLVVEQPLHAYHIQIIDGERFDLPPGQRPGRRRASRTMPSAPRPREQRPATG
jgi:hypothetical protein